jgi:hypothetical protein
VSLLHTHCPFFVFAVVIHKGCLLSCSYKRSNVYSKYTRRLRCVCMAWLSKSNAWHAAYHEKATWSQSTRFLTGLNLQIVYTWKNILSRSKYGRRTFTKQSYCTTSSTKQRQQTTLPLTNTSRQRRRKALRGE